MCVIDCASIDCDIARLSWGHQRLSRHGIDPHHVTSIVCTCITYPPAQHLPSTHTPHTPTQSKATGYYKERSESTSRHTQPATPTMAWSWLSGGKPPVITTTQQGKVEGYQDKTTGVYHFRGIPYAAPPVGALRFKKPQPPQAWEGVRACKQFGKMAVQGMSLVVRACLCVMYRCVVCGVCSGGGRAWAMRLIGQIGDGGWLTD